MVKIQYFIQTKTKKGIKKYSKPYATKDAALRKLAVLESQKKWARLAEYFGLFMTIIEQSSVALLEQTTVIRDSYKNDPKHDPKHQKGIDACNIRIVELQEKINS